MLRKMNQIISTAAIWSMLIFGTGCYNQSKLTEIAVEEAARELAQSLCDSAVCDSISFTVLPFKGEGPTERTKEWLKTQLMKCGRKKWHPLPTEPQAQQLIGAIETIYTHGSIYPELPDIPGWKYPRCIMTGNFRWFDEEPNLTHIGLRADMLSTDSKEGIWSGASRGVGVGYENSLIRLVLFILICVIVERIRELIQHIFQMDAKVPWAGAIMLWVVAFWLLLQDYLFYFWRAA
jgi:hypothetical protein